MLNLQGQQEIKVNLSYNKKDSKHKCHLRAGQDLLSIYINNFPKTKIFSGKSLMIGGSNEIEEKVKYHQEIFPPY